MSVHSKYLLYEISCRFFCIVQALTNPITIFSAFVWDWVRSGRRCPAARPTSPWKTPAWQATPPGIKSFRAYSPITMTILNGQHFCFFLWLSDIWYYERGLRVEWNYICITRYSLMILALFDCILCQFNNKWREWLRPERLRQLRHRPFTIGAAQSCR